MVFAFDKVNTVSADELGPTGLVQVHVDALLMKSNKAEVALYKDQPKTNVNQQTIHEEQLALNKYPTTINEDQSTTTIQTI